MNAMIFEASVTKPSPSAVVMFCDAIAALKAPATMPSFTAIRAAGLVNMPSDTFSATQQARNPRGYDSHLIFSCLDDFRLVRNRCKIVRHSDEHRFRQLLPRSR